MAALLSDVGCFTTLAGLWMLYKYTGSFEQGFFFGYMLCLGAGSITGSVGAAFDLLFLLINSRRMIDLNINDHLPPSHAPRNPQICI
jgi:hypothetical protein